MSHNNIYQGSCFCGAVQFTVTGRPAAMGYCHCRSCRHWSAGPVNAFTLWPPEAVEVTRGTEHIAGYQKTSDSHRKWCRKCGGHIFTDHPAMRLIDVYAALIPDLQFEPEVHVNYQESVLRVEDDVTKFKDIPEDMGGSGICVDARGLPLE